MEPLRRLQTALESLDRGQVFRLASLTGLFFLIICAVGILRPIKNALALEGLAEGQFYRVYLVSAGVVLFVPLFNRLADRIPWRRLLPLTAIFFAVLLLGFRARYDAGSAAFGLLFYGWYDLIAAVLVTQFFMATQLVFDAREAKKFYPVVIAGGSLGATLGGAVTGFTAERVGLPNLMLVAAVLIVAFAVILPLLWREEPPVAEGIEVLGSEDERSFPGLRELARVFGNRQVRLITFAVLLTVMIKQLVDYQFNTITEQVYVTAGGISEFQGWFNAATQWLPLLVLGALGPVLRRWGVGVVLFMFPVFMVLANVGLAATWSLAAAVVAKGGDTGIRYAAERTSREILYVPIPEDLKLRAKGWIDVAVEKGLGKALSAFAIFGLLQVIDFRQVGWVAAGLAAGAVALSRMLRAEYVESLASSLETGVASVRGVYASLTGAEGLPALRRILREGDVGRTAFVLELLGKSAPEDRRALREEVTELLSHPEPSIRRKALELLAAEPDNLEESALAPLLRDEEDSVREAAVVALATLVPDRELPGRLRELLEDHDPRVRRALLSRLARGRLPVHPDAVLGDDYLRELDPGADAPPEARLESALAAGALTHEPAEARRRLSELMEDPDPRVAAAALRSAGWLGDPELDRRIVAALARPRARAAAADALVDRGREVLGLLSSRLADVGEDPAVRRHLPSVMARIPSQETVDALLASYAAPETDQLLDYRTLKALNKLRDRRAEDYRFPREIVVEVLDREVGAYREYGRAERALEEVASGGEGTRLLHRSVGEARAKRRESAFRCLGLILPPRDVYRCFLAVTRGDRKARANALEWVEYEGDRDLYRRLRPVLEDGRGRAPGGEGDSLEHLLRLAWDKDRWIARCALWSMGELVPDRTDDVLDDFRNPDPHLEKLADRLRRGAWGPAASRSEGESSMETIEKVFLLKDVDVLAGADASHLALVAELAEEVRAEEEARLLQRGRPSSAMYVLLDGAVELEGESQELRLDRRGDAFGTWALIDAEPSLVDARAAEVTRLLRVRRARFEDLLADNPELALDLLSGLSRRVRRVLTG